MTSNEELLIIEDCREGNPERFALLYDEYINKIYRYIYFKVQHKETAEDIASIVFLKALENINKFNASKASFSVWIYRIARNTVIDHFRTRKETLSLENIFDLPLEELKIGDRIDIEARIKDVRKYLEKLNPEQRELAVLRIWEGLSYKEIAEIMGKNENSSKVMFSRIMSDLRSELGPMAALSVILLGNLLNRSS